MTINAQNLYINNNLYKQICILAANYTNKTIAMECNLTNCN